MILTLLCWVALVGFIGLSVKKFMEYGGLPQHGRQDLYPIPLEEKERAEYGGSYHEVDKWYEKEHKHNLAGELIDMGMEMLFIKKLFVNQNSFWWVSYSMHLGLYAAIAWSVLCIRTCRHYRHYRWIPDYPGRCRIRCPDDCWCYRAVI